EVLRCRVLHHRLDILRERVGHQVTEEKHRIFERLLRFLEPHNASGDREEVGRSWEIVHGSPFHTFAFSRPEPMRRLTSLTSTAATACSRSRFTRSRRLGRSPSPKYVSAFKTTYGLKSCPGNTNGTAESCVVRSSFPIVMSACTSM